jgi:GTP:adenosylcobinamide-phosphate guanylyltransferase
MKVIVPCGGRSSRYPNQPPKWMLPAHDGRPMLALAVAGLQISLDDLIVTILREHEETYRVRQGLEAAFGRPLQVVVLDEPTRSQPETVARTLEALDLREPFLVKDSDNTFVVEDLLQDTNYVCVDSLNNYDQINPRNKSYLQIDHKGVVTNIREKVVISDLFSVGGYSFLQPEQFLAYYRRLSQRTAEWQRELYISDIIGAMILDGIPFRARQITGYQDWGTITEWKRSLLSRSTVFALLDGFVFERGSEYFHPAFADVKPNAPAVEALKELIARGHSVIYLSIRPPASAATTEAQLAAVGLPAARVVYGCPISTWALLTAPHPTLPFQTSRAFELQPDDPNLLAKLGLEG